MSHFLPSDRSLNLEFHWGEMHRIPCYCVNTCCSWLPRCAAPCLPCFPLPCKHFMAAASPCSSDFQTLLSSFCHHSLSCSLVIQNSIVECYLYTPSWISKEISMQAPKPSSNERVFYVPWLWLRDSSTSIHISLFYLLKNNISMRLIYSLASGFVFNYFFSSLEKVNVWLLILYSKFFW